MSSATPDADAIAGALAPFLGSHTLDATQLEQVRTHVELLMRWNARINLTAVREPAEILTRHFGESFFLATQVFGSYAPRSAIDLGSGAGFPGIPFKIFAPSLQMTLIESNQKKATFLKEAIRALTLTNIDVFAGRARDFNHRAELVTMRAVEKFDEALPSAAGLLSAPGRLALLVGASQVARARQLLEHLKWESPRPVLGSRERVALVGVIA